MIIDFQPYQQVIYRQRCYGSVNQRKWFEPCPIVKQTAKYIVVQSKTYLKGIDTCDQLYPGGEFSVNAKELCETGKAYHSRHGEYFFLYKPEYSDPFPSVDLDFDDPSRIAALLGWEGKPYEWLDWQKECWFIASMTKKDLRDVVKVWTMGGFYALKVMWKTYQEEQEQKLRKYL